MSVKYRGITFPGYNKPIASNREGKKKMVLAKKGDKVKLIHESYGHNYSAAARKSFRAGHKCDTATDILSARYWACRTLWGGAGKPKQSSPKSKKGEILMANNYLVYQGRKGRPQLFMKQGDQFFRVKDDGTLAKAPTGGLIAANLRNPKSDLRRPATAADLKKFWSKDGWRSRHRGFNINTNTKAKAREKAAPATSGSVKVKRGDTLSQIAKAKGTTIKAIMAANPSIKNANMIRVGQTIKIPADAPKSKEDMLVKLKSLWQLWLKALRKNPRRKEQKKRLIKLSPYLKTQSTRKKAVMMIKVTFLA